MASFQLTTCPAAKPGTDLSLTQLTPGGKRTHTERSFSFLLLLLFFEILFKKRRDKINSHHAHNKMPNKGLVPPNSCAHQ